MEYNMFMVKNSFPWIYEIIFTEFEERTPPPYFLFFGHCTYRFTKYHCMKYWFSDTCICSQIQTHIQYSGVSESKIATELETIR